MSVLLLQTIDTVTFVHDVICFGVYSRNSVNDVPLFGGSSMVRVARWPSSVAVTSCHASNPAGAYWRGDETKAQLQRIYGTAWESKEQLKAYQQLKVEAARRSALPLPLQSSWMHALSHFLQTSWASCTVSKMQQLTALQAQGAEFGSKAVEHWHVSYQHAIMLSSQP